MSIVFLTQDGLNRPRIQRKSSENGALWLSAPPGSLLACSAADMSREHQELFGMRRLGEDRKGFFDHLYPSSLFKGVSFTKTPVVLAPISPHGNVLIPEILLGTVNRLSE